MSGPLISLRDVNKYYGDYHALRGITAEIGAGEFFSLLGPSGCGKTTLLRAIAGFEDISGGTITLSGKDMKGVPPNKRPTNMVFQSYAIFPHLSVEQNVGFGLRKSGMSPSEKTRAIGAALEMVGLGQYGKRAAHALSGGQRQRVALARALILKPKVLLLDEPLSALDRKMREDMQVELMKLQREVGITFILVTHDQEEALVMSDRIAVMFEGEIAQLADPEVLYRKPATKRVADFIGVMNFLPARAGDGLEEAIEDNAFFAPNGGTLVGIDRTARFVELPSELPGGVATLGWGHVDRVVYDHPTGLFDLTVGTERRDGWTRLPTLVGEGYTGRGFIG